MSESINYGYCFPAVKGMQTNRNYYSVMCPFRLIPKIFSFEEEYVSADERSQRILNKSRVTKLAEYIASNKDTYVLPSLTATIDGESCFEAFDDDDRIGQLKVPKDTKIMILDGQHRRSAIEKALIDNPDLGDETVPVVLFKCATLVRNQQIFADLNRHVVRPTKSINVLYDHRDPISNATNNFIKSNKYFYDTTDLENNTLSKLSNKLFTLSSFNQANKELVKGIQLSKDKTLSDVIDQFWLSVSELIPEWRNKIVIKAEHIRNNYIHTQGVTLKALGKVGNQIYHENINWENSLKNLSIIDWSRGCDDWQGRAVFNNRILCSEKNVNLIANKIKMNIGRELDHSERLLEEEFINLKKAV